MVEWQAKRCEEPVARPAVLDRRRLARTIIEARFYRLNGVHEGVRLNISPCCAWRPNGGNLMLERVIFGHDPAHTPRSVVTMRLTRIAMGCTGSNIPTVAKDLSYLLASSSPQPF